MDDQDFLFEAINQARLSVRQGGFPAGAIIVSNNQIIGRGISIGPALHDPTSHGEMAAIRDACKNLKRADLSGAFLYASLQPCVMCLGGAMWSGLAKIFYACGRDKLSADYYGGHYDARDVNAKFLRPLDLIHLSALEADSLAVVRQWEHARA